ncbi:MAG: ComF family protein [Myxococcota bacterium]
MTWSAHLQAVVDLLAPPECASCGIALLHEERHFCGGCELLFDRLPHGSAAYAYGGPLAEAIRRVKYGGRTDHVRALGALLEAPVREHLGLVDAVVPVPLHPARLRQRGFDHVTLLGRHVAGVLGVPLQVRRLRRWRATPAQAGLDAAARAANVRAAFEARPDPKRPRVLLFDDVQTTGATLRAAAEALRGAGATRVRMLTLAGTDPLL